MAKATGGGFFREEDLHTLPTKIAGKQERVRTKYEVELWSTPFFFLRDARRRDRRMDPEESVAVEVTDDG